MERQNNNLKTKLTLFHDLYHQCLNFGSVWVIPLLQVGHFTPLPASAIYNITSQIVSEHYKLSQAIQGGAIGLMIKSKQNSISI